jgi:D-sedoheptulose 7-phosphate isomerase
MIESIRKIINESIDLRRALLADEALLRKIELAAGVCIQAYSNQHKLLLCGNGGSAADAQHIAAELTGRFIKDRPALYAEALHVNTSTLTAIANDYGYEHVFERQVEGMGRKGDVLIGLSTSGNSQNVILAMEKARKLSMTTIGLTGAKEGKMKDVSDILINIPSTNTARIQEVHLMIGHILCGIIEEHFF